MAIFIFGILAVAITGLTQLGSRASLESKRQAIATNIASQQIEDIRAMSYEDVGYTDALSNEPTGLLAREEAVTQSGQSYTMTTTIVLHDDPINGTTTPLTETSADYKMAEVTVRWSTTGGQQRDVQLVTLVGRPVQNSGSAACLQDGDCQSGEICNGGSCQAGCNDPGDCASNWCIIPAGQTVGTCQACGSSADCGSPTASWQCVAGACQPNSCAQVSSCGSSGSSGGSCPAAQAMGACSGGSQQQVQWACINREVASCADSEGWYCAPQVTAGACGSPVPSPTPSPTGPTLAAHWKLDDGSGTTATDSSGNGQHGSLVNSPTWVTTTAPTTFANSHALSFDGVDDRVSFPDVDFTNGMTGAMWVRYPTVPTNFPVLISQGTAAAGSEYYVQISGGRFAVSVRTTTQNISAVSVTTIVANQWYHVAWTYDGNILVLYINGQPEASSLYAGTVADYNVPGQIGAWFTGTQYFTNAIMDDVRLYNGALSTSEIQALASQPSATPSPTPSLPPGIAAWWQLNEGSGPVAWDVSGNGQHGSLVNSPTWVTTTAPTTFANSHALSFDGVDDRVSFPDVDFADGMTGAMWVRYPAVPNYHMLIAHGRESTGSEYYVQNYNNQITVAVITTGQTISASSVTTLVPNQWYHLAWTYDNNILILYVNGQAEATYAYTGTVADYNAPGQIGAWYTGTQYFANAIMDDVRLYNTALSASEVQAVAARSGATPSPTPSLLPGIATWWQLNDGTGTIAWDSSGTAKHGALTNGPTWVTTTAPTTFANSHALSFDGVDDRVSFPDVDFADGMTGAIWVRFPTVPTSVQALITEGTGANNEYHLYNYNGRFYLSVRIGSQNVPLESVTTIVANQWYHVAWTYDGTAVVLYVNGQAENSIPRTGTLADYNAPGNIGAWYTGTSYFINGVLDDIRLYGRPLSAAEIQTLATGGNP